MKILSKIQTVFYYLLIYPYYKLVFKHIGSRSKILSPLKIDGSQNISIGNKVIIEYKTWIAALPLTGDNDCKLVIGDGTVIGHFNHIYATAEIIIGKNVLTADKVYISDNLHNYEDINLPIKDQSIKQIQKVSIGDGCWIGENACIIGASIGKGCVIGANSVVTKNIPDYCVVVGAPGRIIKKYNFEVQLWEKVDNIN